MAYEVTKVVNGRAYRYGVRSERDPATGKTRNRWTYLGRAGPAAGPPSARSRTNAREALLDALERLLEREDHRTITAAQVSVEARLAHGTFYRYFRNKADAIRCVLERLRAARSEPEALLLREPAATREDARAALRAWAALVLRAPVEHRGVLRAWYDLAERDPLIGAARRERRDAYAHALAERLRGLRERGFVHVDDADNAASAIFAMLDGFYREAIVTEGVLDDARIAAALDLIERGVFGTL